MNLPLQQHAPKVWRLPDALVGLQVMTIDGLNHLATIACDGYYDPALCGATSPNRNVSRRRDIPEAEIPVCRECCQVAGVDGA